MNDEFKWIEKVERSELSLVGLINANRQMEEEMGKRRRTMWIILGVLAVIALALAVYVGFSLLDPRAGSHDRQFTMMLGGVCLVAMLAFAPAIGIGLYKNTFKPAKRYKEALAVGYPGLDASSEDAMCSYVWTYANDPGKLLGNLSALIAEKGAQRKVRGETYSVSFTPAEQVVLDLWQYAPEIYHELYDLQVSGESEMEYLANVVNSFNAIGATGEADAWLEVRELFAELGVWDFEGEPDEDPMLDPEDENWTRYKLPTTGEHVWVWDVDEDGGEPRAFTEGQRERFLELETRLADCHDDTQAKLYDFVLQNRILFGFEGAQRSR